MTHKAATTLTIALTLILAACAPSAGTTSPAPTSTFPPTATNAPSLAPPFPQTQSVNGLEVELLNALILDGQLTIDICHQMPTQEDWIVGTNPDGTYVSINGKKSSLSGFGILYYRESYKGGKTHRCDALNFDVADPDPGEITLTIDEFYTSVPEVPDCEAAQKKLDDAGTGIKFTCDAGPGYFNYTITEKPENMSDNDARMVVFDSFSSHAKGPWVFDINLPTPLVMTTSTPWPTPAGIEPMDGQMTSANGVDLLVTGNLVDGPLFQVDVCYIPPSSGSAWMLAQSPQDITLDVAGKTYPVDNISYTGWENNYGFPHISERYRCHRLSFTVPEDTDTSVVTLKINSLYEFPADSSCDKTDITFESGKVANTACMSPLSILSGPWIVQTGLGR